jgi:acyl-homoserine-lactone acylase
MPHVMAFSFGSLGFGHGYAMAEDHACSILDVVVQVRGEAAAEFGPGVNDRWINQDAVYRALDLHGTAYSLALVPGDPMSYRYGDEVRPITSTPVEIDVKGADGMVSTVECTICEGHYRLVLSLPGVGWSDELAISIRDANESNNEMAGQVLAMARSGSMDELIDAHRRWQGLPWGNTVAASADGRIWYADTASTPNLSAEAIDGWLARVGTDPLTIAAYGKGVVLLDGSDPVNEWVEVPGTRDPGVEPFEAKPQLERGDYLFNANDPYWVANARELIGGASPLHGLADRPLSNRTRMNVLQLEIATGGAGSDGLFDLEELRATALSNRVLTGELLAEDVVERCRAASIDQAICDVLSAWDRKVDIDSVGAALWRELIGTFAYSELIDAGPLWEVGFDPSDPIGIPSGLSDDPGIPLRLEVAVARLSLVGFDLDTPLGQIQATRRGDVLVPVHGGNHAEGVTNVIGPGRNTTTSEPEVAFQPPVEGSPSLTTDGYPVAAGTSFLYAIELTDEGPEASGFLTYGETGDPVSPHYSDQTILFADKAWRPFAFRPAEIRADPNLERYVVRSGP